MRLCVLLVTDALLPPARGNGTTIARWIEGLTLRGHHLTVVEPGREPAGNTRFDVALGYHADRCGPWTIHLAEARGIPAVISLGGTDLLDLESQVDSPGRQALERAQVVTAAFGSSAARLALQLHRMPRFHTVRRGVFRDPEVVLERPSGGLVIALPAGLRPVKDPLLALQMVRILREAGVALHLEIVGAALDVDYARKVRRAADELGGIRIGQRPPVAMGAVYARSHVVWNTSRHEGGANSVLEAAALGCAAFVRDVPGNRELAGESGSPVTTFRPEDRDHVIAWHRAILREDAAARNARHLATMAWLARWHDPADEIEDLETALRASASTD